MDKVQTCISCGASREKFKKLFPIRAIHRGMFFHKKFDIQICTDCGLTFIDPMPTQDEYGQFYSQQYWPDFTLDDIKADAAQNKRLYDFYYDKWLNDLKPDHKYLDIGGGWGGFTYPLIAENKLPLNNIYFNEPSERALAFVKNELGVKNTEPCMFEDNTYEDNFFDFVLASAIIEHFADPYAAMLHMNRIIKTGGKLVMMTPDTEQPILLKGLYRYFKVAHPYYFSMNTLFSVAKRSGFKVIAHDGIGPEIDSEGLINPKYQSRFAMVYFEKERDVRAKEPVEAEAKNYAVQTIAAINGQKQKAAKHLLFYKYLYYPAYFLKNAIWPKAIFVKKKK